MLLFHNTHDPTVCLIDKGELQGIYEEERFNRIKISRGHFPLYALKALLKDNDLDIRAIDFSYYWYYMSLVKGKIEEVLNHHFGYSPEINLFTIRSHICGQHSMPVDQMIQIFCV